MQQLVSSLIQYNIFQISVLVAHAVLFYRRGNHSNLFGKDSSFH